ncbi:GAF domain-containing sensor histidine kinase [Pontibacter sp. JH31]|uniref:GAF domain-containing sensor histidine kinase n=1 Tax=Pontibacter aquaedesilientis TaxID=2766980 RepID=A0ABR7XBT4_9BACT|nr:GAF domain-containing sensor histidine kinase [Pontibacter aquaedesilientis]MBD1395757.1 GAF domain-containing sensor histidine kinase [Pontibacter aquaedesilientis]
MMKNDIQVGALPYEKPASIIPENDQARLRALYRYEILDSAPEEFFEKITRMVARLLNTPSAFISLVDADRVWYKANFSTLDVPCVDREDSLCSLTIINEEKVTVFENTHDIPSLLSSPFVSSENGIRFYAGAPLITHDGYNLGTLCVIDGKPRTISEEEQKILLDLANLVMNHIEMRAMARKAIRKHDELYAGLVREVEVPLREQQLLLKEALHVPKPVNILKTAIQLVDDMSDNVRMLQASSLKEEDVLILQREMVPIATIAKNVVDELTPLADAKELEVFFTVASRRELLVDPDMVYEAIFLLLNHLIKYTPKQSSIAIDIFEDEQRFIVEISNEHSTLTKADLSKMFFRYATLEGKATGNEHSSGLELALVKNIVHSHGASIVARVAERGEGTNIVIDFPTV